jgi:hypothetical protein
MLAAHRARGQQLVGDVRFEVDEGADRVAVGIGRVGRTEAREHLGARCGRGAVGQHHAAVAVGIRFARVQLVAFAARFDADRHVQRRGQEADVDLAHAGQVQHRLVVAVAAGVEHGLAGRADRAVQGVLDLVIHLVLAVDDGCVHVPGAQRPGHAAGGAVVVDGRRDDRQEAVRIDRLDVAHILRGAEVAGRAGVAVLVAGPAVDLDVRP